MARILSGKQTAQKWLQHLSAEIQKNSVKFGPPKLGILQVGDNPASSAYIGQKIRVGKSCGIEVELKKLPQNCAESEIRSSAKDFAVRSDIDAFIIQLPLDHKPELSAQFSDELIGGIPPNKDADGLTSVNQGRVFTGESTATHWQSPLPATPFGILKLLVENGIEISGKDIVVVGKSRLVGFPTAALLAHAGGTVTLCHSKTQNLSQKSKSSQILIVAAGRKHLVQPDFVNPQSVVIDVGIHRDPKTGGLTGDVDPRTFQHCLAYSPVPGGVGPMTVAALMYNTYYLYLQNRGIPAP